ncbi:hypothetical protein LQW54_012151 [Pestalotiopsis sp. IQ-011]
MKAPLRAGPLKADIRLAQALSEFEASLPPDDKARLRSAKYQSQSRPPTSDDVMRFTAEKSAIGQITSSLSDAKIRNWGDELTRWAQLIKDEASLLLTQTTEYEAVENSHVRKWLARSIDSSAYQRRIDKRLQWLTAFSAFDYETPWKQARKRGSSTFFTKVPSYKQWKEKQGPPNLLLSGKMGCGKSVIMANMVEQALAHNDWQQVKLLLEKGARTDIYMNESPLHSTIRRCPQFPETLVFIIRILRDAKVIVVIAEAFMRRYTTFYGSLLFATVWIIA